MTATSAAQKAYGPLLLGALGVARLEDDRP
jgi:hypothetical protein